MGEVFGRGLNRNVRQFKLLALVFAQRPDRSFSLTDQVPSEAAGAQHRGLGPVRLQDLRLQGPTGWYLKPTSLQPFSSGVHYTTHT